MQEQEVLHSQDDTLADRLARRSEGWQWREMTLRALMGIGAVAIAIVVILLFTKIAKAPSDGPTNDCANVVSMVETFGKDCTRK